MQDIHRDFPKEYPRAFATLSRGLKTRIGNVVRTGQDTKLGVFLAYAPLNPITRMSRKRSTFGGALAKSITSFVSSKGCTIRWPYGLRRYGLAFQQAENRPYDERGKRFLYAIMDGASGIGTKKDRKKKAEIDAKVQTALEEGYQRPARRVWEPVSDSRGFKNYCLDVVRKRIAAIIEKRAKVKP